MYRFVMPEPDLNRIEQYNLLCSQFESFLKSDALCELFDLLEVDRTSFCRIYNGRRLSDGKTLETQELEPVADLEKHRDKIYPILNELGFLTINKPLEPDHSHLVVLGGSLEACFSRTRAAKLWMSPSVGFADGLACYRPIHPTEREADLSSYQVIQPGEREADLSGCQIIQPGERETDLSCSQIIQSVEREADFTCPQIVHSFGREADLSCLINCETEMGAMTESFVSVFSLPHRWKDDFQGDRNLNNISCIRAFSDTPYGRQYRVFAAPSTNPKLRRADTGDSVSYYLQKAGIGPSDYILFLTNNRYCNRQFLQLAYLMMEQEQSIRFDIIGCTPDERVISCERYDPYQFFQDLIGVLDWIERFLVHRKLRN